MKLGDRLTDQQAPYTLHTPHARNEYIDTLEPRTSIRVPGATTPRLPPSCAPCTQGESLYLSLQKGIQVLFQLGLSFGLGLPHGPVGFRSWNATGTAVAW